MEDSFAKFLLEKLQKDYNLIADTFASQRRAPWIEGKFLVENYVREGDKILDLGCGAGQWYEFFKEKKVEYWGVDFSEKLIEIAKKRYQKAKFVVCDTFKLPFEDNFFDKVYAIALFHHLPSEKRRILALKEIKRVLKKNGLLILTVWNLWQGWKNKKQILKFSILKIFGKTKLDFGDILIDWKGAKNCYFHCFRISELKKLISCASLDIIKIDKFSVGKKNSNFYLIARPHSLMDKIQASGA